MLEISHMAVSKQLIMSPPSELPFMSWKHVKNVLVLQKKLPDIIRRKIDVLHVLWQKGFAEDQLFIRLNV